ncbi:MAG: trypsin-like peptidase domain-containing protein [Tepidamorphaceae bacterium]|nr:trypsin-like peptidase domain-containing protein [Rhodobiaceae bacterium]MCC0049935.1 trypsin-like peptidase domain-containing protein [Rhodobiaceae bacterium]
MIELNFIGTDPANTANKSFDTADEILVGRDQSWAQFVIPAAEKLVSRRHARLYRDASGAWRVERQGDRFISVNGIPVEQSSVLKSGDTLTLGKSSGPTLDVTFQSVALPGGDEDRTATQEIVRSWRDYVPGIEAMGSRIKILTGAVAMLAVIAAGTLWYVSNQTLDFSDATLQRLEQAAYLVVLRDGNGGESAIGTAWPVAANKLVTNAHVAELFDKIDRNKEHLLVRSPGSDPKSYDVGSIRIHSGYKDFSGYVDRQSLGTEGFRSTYTEASRPSAFDVALLIVDPEVTLSPVLELAEKPELAKAGPGSKLAFAGYPLRCVDGSNTEQIAPTPSVQQGAVSSITDYFLFPPASVDEGLLVQHSVPATGGASGGPLIGLDGKVIAVLSGGTVIDTGGKEGEDNPCRMSPSAVMVNYAQRADLVAELLAQSDEEAIRQRHAYWETQVAKFANHYAYLKRQVVADAEKAASKTFDVVMEDERSEPVAAAGNKISFDVEEGREYAVLVYNRNKGNMFVDLKIDGKSVAQNGNGWMPALRATAPVSGKAELTIYATGGKQIDYNLMVAKSEE